MPKTKKKPYMTAMMSLFCQSSVRTAGLRWTRIEAISLNDSQHFVTLIGYLTIYIEPKLKFKDSAVRDYDAEQMEEFFNGN